MPGVLLLGHRGASRLAPENTLVALQKALELGADGVEVDVQRTSDGTLVLVHDDTWLRTAARPAPVATTPWSDVRHFDVGRWFDAAYTGVRAPRLQDVLDAIPAGAYLNLELKSPALHPGLGLDVLEALRGRASLPRILITSFDRKCIEALVGAGPAVELGILGTRALPLDGPVQTQVLAFEAILAEPSIVPRIHAAGGRVLAWTVDDARVARQLVDVGVDGLISNDPGRLRP